MGLLGLLAEREFPASVANDFADIEKWLPVSELLITYVAGPYPDATQTRAIRQWVEAGGHWLRLHGTTGGRGPRGAGDGHPPPPHNHPPPPPRPPLFPPSPPIHGPPP